MNFDDLFNELNSDNEEIEDGPLGLDIDIIQSNIQLYDNKRLCEMIVCVRYFGLENKISIICMNELARRRADGELFDFETYIEESYKELPALHLGNTDLRSILGQIITSKKVR